MSLPLVLATSILLQFTAAFLALRLIWITDKKRAWALIAIAIFLMTLRRCITLYQLISGDITRPPDLTAELVALAISTLMVVGIVLIAPLFLSIKRADETVLESEKKYRSLFETSRDAVYLSSLEGFFVDINQAGVDLFGYTKDELLSTKMEKIYVNPINREKFIQKVKRQGFVKDYEVKLKRKDGTLIDVLITAAPRKDRDNVLLGFHGIIRDITERKQAEEILSNVAKGVSATTGKEFFRSLVKYMSKALKADFALIGELSGENNEKVKTIALCIEGKLADNLEYELAGSPCENVMRQSIRTYPQGIQKQFPLDSMLVEIGAESYSGSPLRNSSGQTLGIMAILNRKPFENPNMVESMLEIFAVRASAELERVQTEDSLRKKSEQTIHHQQVLTELAKTEFSDLESALKRITEVDSKTLGVERVSVWFFNKDRSEIFCEDLYKLSENLHEKGVKLEARQYPCYFQALEESRIIAANDARNDPRTKEFTEGYLKPLGITSMLDVTVRLHGEVFGAVCHEHTGPIRKWTEEEQSFAASVADSVSLAIEDDERKRAEEALAGEKERLAVTLRSIGDGVITTDTKGRVILMNRMAEKLTGWTQEDAAGKPFSNIFRIINEQTREPCTNPFEKVMKASQVVGLVNNTMLIAKNGKERIIADSGAPIRDKDCKIIGVVLVFRDITEKRKMEQELLKTQKLESLGLLAGGIAHDFNNALTAILGNISIAKFAYQNKSEDVKIQDILSSAEKAVLRARGLTQQLLTFSKGGSPVKKTTDISELVKETVGFALKGSASKCRFEIPGGLFLLEIDEDQISQVINNLAINADQAMPEGGIVNVRVENITIDANNPLPLKPGPNIRVSIEDNGTGIPPEHIERIFHPYFSTKGRGSGLGLSVSYSIIRNHGGYIHVSSKLGKGSTFHVYLPTTDKPLSIEKKKEDIIKGTGRVLVMDDDESIRKSLQAVLTVLGYRIELAKNGKEAVEKYKEAEQSGQAFDAVILDLTIPGGMGGKKTVQELKKIDSNVKAIVSSGYSNDPVLANYREYGFVNILEKPYEVEKVSSVLQNVIKKDS